MTDPLDRIADFQRRLVIPVFREIGASPRLAAKGRHVRTVYALRTGDDVTDDLLGRVHGARRSLVKLPRTPAAERGGEWVGPTLIVAEPPELRAPHGDPQAGIYYSSVLYRLRGDGDIFVAPFVFFWMRFDGKPHAFAHRYDDLLADHPIEQVSRGQIVNHALSSLTFFDMHALSTEKPW
ncbi:MAG: hypothetical protein JST00_20110 [Deltaproteobacteria bacterium]|nr:hypothetical protein [Deltaproteobacteria bacterium]